MLALAKEHIPAVTVRCIPPPTPHEAVLTRGGADVLIAAVGNKQVHPSHGTEGRLPGDGGKGKLAYPRNKGGKARKGRLPRIDAQFDNLLRIAIPPL